MIPYGDITQAADRRWTARLLDRLADPGLPDAELGDLVAALQAVSDPRSVGPLEDLLTDRRRPAPVREAAGKVLRGMDTLVPDVPEAKLRRWWHEGDPVLRRHALLCMDACDCPDVVLAVASDPGHPLHAEALEQLTFDFDRPAHLRLKVAGLAHPDPRVRQSAAGALFWDEPVVAEGPLLDAAADPVPEVVAEVCGTLRYYPSLRTARRLHGLLGHPAERVREEARAGFEDVRHEFLVGLKVRDPRVTRHVRRWLEPVWDLLAFTDDELRPDEEHARATPPTAPPEPLPVPSLLQMLGDPDASPRALRESLWRCAWRAYSAGERAQLRPLLLGHPDPFVREEAAWALIAWHDADGLLALVLDTDFGVRKAAMYQLGKVPPTASIGELAWKHLHRPDALGVHATETLDAFVRHADPAEAVRRLGWIAGDHGWPEGLRELAVHDLGKLGAAESVGQLLGLLQEPPAVTWALHIALLAAARDLGLPVPDISHLRGVDNLFVQEAVAEFDPA
jgi:HEAT repeat protein